MEKVFLTFADSRMHRSLNRIKRQVLKMNTFDKVLIRNETDLSPDFREHFKDQLVLGTRGFGYWCWKPQIILQTLQNLNDGDILNYSDAGCHYNTKGKKRLEDYFDLTVRDNDLGILGFEAVAPDFHDGRFLLDHRDGMWTKGDLLDYFHVRDNPKIVETQTICATCLFIRKSGRTVDFVKQWLDVFYKDFSLVDDSPSKSPNPVDFRENRHDQAVWSILCKLNNVKTVSMYETYYPSPNDYYLPDWHRLERYPIWAKRNKATHSLLYRAARKAWRLSMKFFSRNPQ